MGIIAAHVRQNSILSNVWRFAMAKTSASKPGAPGGKPAARGLLKGSAGRTKVVQRDENTGQLAMSKARFEAVILAAERSGLLSGKSSRIGWQGEPGPGQASQERCASDGSADGSFQGEENPAQKNQFITFNENNRGE
jgi:hypothetical protein